MIRKTICYTVLLSDSGCKNKMLCYVMLCGGTHFSSGTNPDSLSYFKLLKYVLTITISIAIITMVTANITIVIATIALVLSL